MAVFVLRQKDPFSLYFCQNKIDLGPYGPVCLRFSHELLTTALDSSSCSFHSVTTTNNPVIREQIKTIGCNIYATDAILAVIVVAPVRPHSWHPWPPFPCVWILLLAHTRSSVSRHRAHPPSGKYFCIFTI